ncbi:antibiotic biosynthesis monooxygenase [Microbispora sp. RL4-1S]|uniref:Antibiotic biosynthesis monooxygenase n=1 Tax=Microbispora oryzae TaxID=2806554 RepID=A0A941ASG7_9ACTN|nr:antibiotic biosynthesis monooxygenase family protein [Microbispora oryzae]MBP2708284.1 antibiotic biosynthesis monooxygenase [Microbispora oryzae]
MTVRVLLRYRGSEDEIGAAFHTISRKLQGTPGLLGSELWRDIGDSRAFVVSSEWTSREAFDTWERGPDHKATTQPLRPYHDSAGGRAFELVEVVAAYR